MMYDTKALFPDKPEHISQAYIRFREYIDYQHALKPKDLAEWLMLEELYITYKRDEI